MKKLVALLLIWAIAIVANCSEKDFAFFYSFNKKDASGYKDLAGNLPNINPIGKWEMRKNTIYLDGKTGRIPLIGTQKITLVNKTLLAMQRVGVIPQVSPTVESAEITSKIAVLKFTYSFPFSKESIKNKLIIIIET